jgi:hypothetical protein
MSDFGWFVVSFFGPMALISLGIAVWLSTRWGKRWLEGGE